MNKIKNYKIIDTSGGYIYSTKHFERLLDYMVDVLGYDRPEDFDEAVKVLESGDYYLITK